MRLHRVRIVNVRLRPHWRPRVTDHALARYIQRVYGVRVTPDHVTYARKALTSDAVENAILHGVNAVQISKCKVVIEGRHVVTVLAPGMRVFDRDRREDHNARREGLRRLADLNRAQPVGER